MSEKPSEVGLVELLSNAGQWCLVEPCALRIEGDTLLVRIGGEVLVTRILEWPPARAAGRAERDDQERDDQEGPG